MQPDNKDIIKELHKFFKSNDLTLSVVESCTGGLISSMITDLPGASDYFDSGIVTYSIGSKSDLVSVQSTTLIKDGSVSEETARQMAEGTRRLRKTDHSLSVTGNLGPSALEGKDVGLVYFAATSSGGTYSKGMRFSGTRKQIKRQAALYALQFLHDVTDL
jgi:PncC family amidohydrolase